MICAWQSFIEILPLWMRPKIDRIGKNSLIELRMRLNQPLILKTITGNIIIEQNVTREDMHFCINTASRYSPWLTDTAEEGYITAEGGHRIGLCGNASGATGTITDISGITSLCLRVARDFSGVSNKIPEKSGSVLILGRPGSGKTTLLRDLIRKRSQNGECISVVDERREIFPRVSGKFCFETGPNTDVLSGCKKTVGIETVLRAMSPDTIAVDEITKKEDCNALVESCGCGVNILATIHAESKDDLLSKTLYRTLIENKLFDIVVLLSSDKTYTLERLTV